MKLLSNKKHIVYKKHDGWSPHFLWQCSCMVLVGVLAAELFFFSFFFLHITKETNQTMSVGIDPAIEKLSTLHKKIESIRATVETRTGEKMGE